MDNTFSCGHLLRGNYNGSSESFDLFVNCSCRILFCSIVFVRKNLPQKERQCWPISVGRKNEEKDTDMA